MPESAQSNANTDASGFSLIALTKMYINVSLAFCASNHEPNLCRLLQPNIYHATHASFHKLAHYSITLLSEETTYHTTSPVSHATSAELYT